MSIMNHSIPSNGHPAIPPNGPGTQGSSHHPPLAPSWQGAHSLKPFHPASSVAKKTSLNISRGDSIKGAAEYSACSKLPDTESGSFRNGIGDLSHLLSPDAASAAPLGLLTDAMVELDRKLSGGGRQQNVAVLHVAVSSAVKLDDTQVDLIARKMRRLTGFGNLRLENIVDPSLIAGFVISYGMGDSHVIDLSVKGQLAALAAKMEFSDKRRVANHGQSWNFSNSIK